MAAVTSSSVTINSVYYTGVHDGSRRKVVDATLVLSSQGGASNSIGAALFGLTSIDAVLSCQTDGDTVIDAKPNYARTLILLYAYNSASTADISDTIRVVVMGRE